MWGNRPLYEARVDACEGGFLRPGAFKMIRQFIDSL